MKALNQNCITESHIDFEYKKYILLSYLKEMNKNFNEQKLYPFLSDLLQHYLSLNELKDKKVFVANHFPKQISRFDF